jgi:hypothetical protein
MGELAYCVHPVAIKRDRRLVFRNGLLAPALSAQYLRSGIMRIWTAGRCSMLAGSTPQRVRHLLPADSVMLSTARPASSLTNALCARTDRGSRVLIYPHQPRIPGHISGKDRGETAFDGLFHGCPPAKTS